MPRSPIPAALLALAGLIGHPAAAPAQVALPRAKPVPRMQAVPLDGDRVSFQRDGAELTVFHHGPDLARPILFPVNGPAGRSLTRMGHPHDPVGHRHHNSVWFAHNDVGGENFWLDTGGGRVARSRVVRLDDGDAEARVVAEAEWVGKDGRPLLAERRGITVRPLEGRDWLLVLDLQITPARDPVTLGATPFGMVGVRVAKSLGVNDGGGLIRNSEGQEGETGPNPTFRRPARWMDYSGLIAPDTPEGVTLMDHPANPNHPTKFHVRADGWMGASLTIDGPITVAADRPLRLRYGLLVHAGVPTAATLDARWSAFAAEPIADLPAK